MCMASQSRSLQLLVGHTARSRPDRGGRRWIRLQIWKLEQKIKANTLQCRTAQRNGGIQAIVTQIIYPFDHGVSIADKALRRIVLWAPALSNRPSLKNDIIGTLGRVKGSKQFFVVALLRTWFDGWTTSYRAHSEKSSCILGTADRLLHYMECNTLWNDIYSLSGEADDICIAHSLALKHDDKDRRDVKDAPHPSFSWLSRRMHTATPAANRGRVSA